MRCSLSGPSLPPGLLASHRSKAFSAAQSRHEVSRMGGDWFSLNRRNLGTEGLATRALPSFPSVRCPKPILLVLSLAMDSGHGQAGLVGIDEGVPFAQSVPCAGGALPQIHAALSKGRLPCTAFDQPNRASPGQHWQVAGAPPPGPTPVCAANSPSQRDHGRPG